MATDRAIENAEKIIKLTEEREAQTQKIKDLLKDIDKLSGAALDKRKEDIKEAKIILQVKFMSNSFMFINTKSFPNF